MSLTLPKLTPHPSYIAYWSGLTGSSMALAITQLQAQSQKPFLIVTESAQQSQEIAEALQFFCADKPVVIFPDWETLAYDRLSPHPDIIADRLAALYQQLQHPPAFLITQISSIMHRLLPKSFLLQHSFMLQRGEVMNRLTFLQRLDDAGYQRVSQVLEHGDYAVRGSLVDVFPMGAPNAIRIDWLDDEIDGLRWFDVQNQRSLDQTQQITLLPAKEFPLDEAGIHHFRQSWREQFPDNNTRQNWLYQSVSKGQSSPGLEYYLPLFYAELSQFFDYLTPETHLITLGNLHDSAHRFWHEIEDRWQLLKLNTQEPVLPPDQLFLRPEALFQQLNHYPRYQLDASAITESNYWPNNHLPDLSIDASREDSLWRFSDWLKNNPSLKVLLCAESAGRREVLVTWLKKSNISVQKAENWQDFLSASSAGLYLCIAPIFQSFWIGQLAQITEQSFIGQQVQQRRRKRSSVHADFQEGIRSLAELDIGDPIVHIDHGVGRFAGLETLTVDQVAREFVCLSYQGEDKLYVPVTSLHLISRYSGGDPENAPWHKLGTDRWQKARKQAIEKVSDVATELLDLYATRAARKGYAFHLSDTEYAQFAAAFPFETTPDQQAAIDAVLDDMKRAKPMDRLVCGDVGFGKTEVAMRAAFIAVQDGKQVAVLVPTTLLANQHLQNFRDRFADWPVRIEGLSRFVSAKEQNQAIQELQEGKVDIVIGTHKLLQQDIQFSKLGLIIIDEEHRFGVKQKEHLKQLRTQVDILTMTATPIPRTLSMAFADLRDMSIIATPPAKRQSVQTFVQTWNDDLVKEACLRELRRGGQVYVLFNDVDRMPTFTDNLQRLLPDARIAMAHGQMPERQLEQVMREFYHRQHHILVCTTIIETGIDIPNANTIIIDRADKFGLAQLHQLRGRVGRSHHKAYAYLFTPPKESLSTDAVKRLEAIARHDQLGAGFALATQDLEIRGAGELLGHDQSGSMHEIGFELYAQLLDKAVRAYKRGEIPDLLNQETGCEVDLSIPAYIPDDYLPDINTRLVLYKRINAAEHNEALEALQVEMIDRFGLLPDPCKNLFQLMQLKHVANQLGISKLEAGKTYLRLTFQQKTPVDPMRLIQLIQQQPKSYQFDGPNRLKYNATFTDHADRIIHASRLLTSLSS